MSLAMSNLPFVKGPAHSKPVELAKLDISVCIVGLFSETTQVMEFHNPNSRDVEGELQFPLPDNAVVSGYGLDVGGAMVEGVVVEKKEARRILEAEIRRGADPGLVERVKGNVYRTRVYPILAGKCRVVSVTYSAPLNADSECRASFHLPLAHCSEVAAVTLTVEMCQTPVSPQMNGGLPEFKLLQTAEGRFNCRGELSKGVRADDLAIVFDKIPKAFVSAERCGDALYFKAVCAKLDSSKVATVWKPSALGVVWDASGSRKDVAKDLALLRSLLAAVCESTALKVHVTVFRNCADERASFECPTESDALFGFLKALHYDGATNLTALDLRTGADAFLLFSDGLHTADVGDDCESLPQICSATRVFTVNSSANCDWALLNHISDLTGAKSFNLLRQSVEDSVSGILACVLKEAVTVNLHKGDGSVVDAAAADCFVKDNGSNVVVCGRISAASESAQVAIGGIAPAQIRLKVDNSQATVCDCRKSLLAKNWVGFEAERLRVTGGNNAAERIVELGRRFGVVTTGTSLLVLETLDQYLEYEIEPPLSRESMHREYVERVQKTQKQKNEQLDTHMTAVMQLWEQRLQWYDTDFAEIIEARRIEEERRREEERTRYSGEEGAGHREDERRRREEECERPRGGEEEARRRAEEEAEACRRQNFSENCEDASEDEDSDDDKEEEEESASFEEKKEKRKCKGGAESAQMSSESGDEKEESTAAPLVSASACISVRKWEPDADYLRAIKKAATVSAKYAEYMKQRASYWRSPAFFLDCGDYFFGDGGSKQLAVRILLNLSEEGLDSGQLKRMQAYRLIQANELDLAVAILQAVHCQRGDEPQSHRDLALALARRWELTKATNDAKRAVALFCNVIQKAYANFPEIEVIALVELNRLLQLVTAHSGEWPHAFLDARFATKWKPLVKRPLQLDIRISMQWDTDLTDVDLHVYEPPPFGEHCNYSHNRTSIGGLVSRDFTQGYGPEEYILKKAQKGKYTVKAHYYSSRAQAVSGAVTVIVDVFTNFGRVSEKRQTLTLRLEKSGEEVLVGDVAID